jgi:glutathione S-transferase
MTSSQEEPMRLYDHPASANGYKVRLALAQTEQQCEVIDVDIFSGGSRTPQFMAKNPAGRVPVLELSSGETLPESNAIVWYLAEGTPLLPGDRWSRAQVVRWMSFEQYEIEAQIGSARFWMLTGKTKGREAQLDEKLAWSRRTLSVLERYMADRKWFVGDGYTIADLSLYAYTHLAPDAGLSLADFPSLRGWLERVEGTPRFFVGPSVYPVRVG